MSQHSAISDPIRTFATDVVRQLAGAGYTALWAGGCVRDLMLGRLPQDYDVATDARPEQVRDLFGKKRTLAVGESFGVVIVLGPSRDAGQVEVATFRKEGEYTDGRRPDRVEYCTPEEDAQRRDFTINGMFYNPLQEQVLDYVGGEQDLGEGIVRAIGLPHDRMSEDKLRMLRAARFTATLEFQLDESTAQAIREMADSILVVSWERIAQELRRMLIDQHRERAMRLCHDLGLLQVILPELADILQSHQPAAISDQSDTPREWWHTLHILGNLEAPSFELAMAALVHTVASPTGKRLKQAPSGTVRALCKRLKLSNAETDQIAWLVANQHALDDAPHLPLCELKRLLVHDHIEDLLKLSRRRALAQQRETSAIDFAAGYKSEAPSDVLDPPELIDGSDLRQLGLTPGPQFQTILRTVRDAQLNEEIATQAEAISLARELSQA